MKLNYHPDTGSLYIDLSEKTSVESREISEGVVLDYDAEGKMVGIHRQCRRNDRPSDADGQQVSRANRNHRRLMPARVWAQCTQTNGGSGAGLDGRCRMGTQWR